MLERIAIVVQALALSLWAGAMASFAFIFAPSAFRTIGNMTTFGALTGSVLRTLASFGAICGVTALVASFGRDGGIRNRMNMARNVLVLVALAATAYEQRAIVPKMESISAQISGAIDSVAKEDPRRAAYDAEHRASTRVYGLAFLCVLAAVALVAFGRRRPA